MTHPDNEFAHTFCIMLLEQLAEGDDHIEVAQNLQEALAPHLKQAFEQLEAKGLSTRQVGLVMTAVCMLLASTYIKKCMGMYQALGRAYSAEKYKEDLSSTIPNEVYRLFNEFMQAQLKEGIKL